jgi:3-oxoadipate enol-lactonase
VLWGWNTRRRNSAWERLGRDDEDIGESPASAFRRLRLEMLAAKRETFIAERDSGRSTTRCCGRCCVGSTSRRPRSIVTSAQLRTVLGGVHVKVNGTGEAMLFWPSLLMTGDMWAAQADHFGQRYRVILVDPPGHGRSQPLTGMFSFDDCARCVADILDGIGIDRAHFVGNSWGGMIGGTFAATYPDRIGRAVLMNCTASAARTRQKIEYGILLGLARVLGGIRPPLTRSVLKAFLGPTTFRTRPEVVTYVRDAVHRVNLASGAWAVKSVVPARPDQRALLANVATPVLVVAGAEDATFPVAETRAMADAIPGSTFAALDGVAHLAALENPVLVNELIEEFVSRPSPPRDGGR